MSLILILAHTAVLVAASQQVLPVWPGPDIVESDRVKILKVSHQLPQELDWYASIGYRIVEMRGDVLRLERSSNPGDHREYLAILPDKVSMTEALMNDAASRGFRLVPRALLGYWERTGVVMVKDDSDGPSSGAQYRILDEPYMGWIEKKMIRAAKDGYRLVAIKEDIDETTDDRDSTIIAVLEKRDTLDKGIRENALLDLELMSLHRASPERLQKLTIQGFRIVFAQNPFLMLERMSGVGARREYAVIAERTRTDLQRAMNDAVRRGFRLIPGTFLTFNGIWKTWVTTSTVIMERTGDPGPEPEYIVAETEDEKELSNLGARGYTYLEGRIFMRLPSR